MRSLEERNKQQSFKSPKCRNNTFPHELTEFTSFVHLASV